MKRALLALIGLLFLAQIASAQHSTPPSKSGPAPAPSSSSLAGDPRVRSRLIELGLTPNTDSDGDFKLILKTEGTRTQLAFAISKTNSYGSVEIREVWSPAFKTGGSLSAAMANRLLIENNKYKLGFWRLVGTGDSQVVIYAVQISADADAKSLEAALKTVTLIADDMEKEQLGTDDF